MPSTISNAFQAVGLKLATQTNVSEADIQSDIKMFLLLGNFGLDENGIRVQLEAPTGTGRRIDIKAGRTVIEVKRSISNVSQNELTDFVEQLRGYVEGLSNETGKPCIGILTDGSRWKLFQPQPNSFALVSEYHLIANGSSVDQLAIWLEACMALSEPLNANPTELLERLGRDSPSYKLSVSLLKIIWNQHYQNPSVALKRQLWSQMCGMIFGTHFTGDDELFFDHTYLIVMTKVIAHKLLELNLLSSNASEIITGKHFSDAGIYGVIDSDIFDWILEANGASIVEDLARRIQHFDFSQVEHDILKYLYEGVISQETRHSLGEYYTPDWLAELVVNSTISEPLTQVVLDPACGSGTFIFHAVRKFIVTAQSVNVPPVEFLSAVQDHVFGMDLHPVAVQLAKVTWLLAIGSENIRNPDRPELRAPVSLGDSIQWRTGWVVILDKSFEVVVERAKDLLDTDISLSFPLELLDDINKLETLLDELERLVLARNKAKARPSVDGIVKRLKLSDDHKARLQRTLNTLCDLEDEGRNHVWGYFVRNQAKPAHFTRSLVDVIVGNPPWLSYRFMESAMKESFKQDCMEEGLWTGGRMATQQDLASYFFFRAAKLYLKQGGTIAMVMPFSTLSRQQYAGFRSGSYQSIYLQFGTALGFEHVSPVFPIPAAVVTAIKSERPRALPTIVESFTGRFPSRELTLVKAEQYLSSSSSKIFQIENDEYISEYASLARQGASVVPRMLFCVTRQPLGGLGTARGRIPISSFRSSDEKSPWKNLPSLNGSVEEQFLMQLCLGETILPFRIWNPRLIVVPIIDRDTGDVIDSHIARDRGFSGLAGWLEQAERTWEDHKSSNMSLYERINYNGELSVQFPRTDFRMVYPTSGTNLCAAVLRDENTVIDTKSYWVPSSENEALYLASIFNSPIFLEKVSRYQSTGLMGTRDFHKHPFRIPIPKFERTNDLHMQLVDVATRAERIAEAVDLGGVSTSTQARRAIRHQLATKGVFTELDRLVARLLESLNL